MDTQFLETFLVVVERGSMAEAARRLGISPAAVAQRIAALEAEIGAPLLMRSGRAVQPSDAGHAIIAQSQRILTDLRQLRLIARADQPGGELRLGAISTALTGLLPPALRRLTSAAPDLDIFVLPGTSPELYRQLSKDSLDAAILVQPPFAFPKTMEFQVLRREPMVLLCPEAWADEDPAALLRDRPFIRYDRNNWGGRLLDNWLKAQHLNLREWLELDQLEAIAVMVSNELGVSILPDWAPPWPEGLRVRRLPLPAPEMPSREIVLMWNRASPAARLIRKLQTELQLQP
ncbi:LysR family transcriptional regulator [Paracoccus laeviglucosivorans]|uniref:DNA-binding transcriptional regulator, LysR family n=1 Tax=Paracoccus laeviglucosivorans TaxID=1197861 RepID=A0A521E8Y1_9RHOB|nr:LysR family transcriptional regulator [Paracoccus laeviglucosivorans]SMO80369.1 DNA-binding transcriptional regulator, LysR family [Paracoccus laeviglucosivorans]